MKDNLGLIITFIVVILIVLTIVGIQSDREEQAEWDLFAKQHKCEIVCGMKGDMITGVGPSFSGNGGMAMTISRTPDKECWKCDDGNMYWRNKP